VNLDRAKLRQLLALRTALYDEITNAPKSKVSDLQGQVEIINEELRRRRALRGK